MLLPAFCAASPLSRPYTHVLRGATLIEDFYLSPSLYQRLQFFSVEASLGHGSYAALAATMVAIALPLGITADVIDACAPTLDWQPRF